MGAAEESEFRSAGASGLIRWMTALWGLLHPKGPFCFRPVSARPAIASSTDTYLTQGVFDPDAMVALLRSETARALRKAAELVKEKEVPPNG